MKKIKVLALVLFFVCSIIISAAFMSCKSAAKNSKEKDFKYESRGFALVELFTSEGCSSCPPADDLIAKVQKEVGDKPIYILAYHVDYWNRLGWKDVFSSSDYSKRQNEYARWLKLSQVYTPQVVVNGKTEFVGSQEEALRNAIKNGLQGGSNIQLSLNVTPNADNTASVQYKIEGNAGEGNNVITLALVQKQAEIKVERGENGGRTLAHTQIVRTLQSQPLSKNTGTATLALPAGFKLPGWEVIGFVQNSGSGAILGVSKVRFKATAKADNQYTKNIL
ncbi:DUF1223 domain-containing protein [Mucilaginibacter sp. SMC90]|uniref:DUF1223 domain-containing protein n=1 Tax=Mucilaginibacter sp. SMC90 TaxID=2929803 RepID=UPI001FB4EB17|nr:DUF1223 domain-containing protein [Mucilaginibacter sp. SMC90]UOE49329.1 DUF1223 domain-containing protein [Mucilaginibacter sp. SMC90]